MTLQRRNGKHGTTQNTNPFAVDLPKILSFFAKQFEEGKQYRSLNCCSLAISSAQLPVEGFPVGKHPLVCRLLKGGLNLRPRYDSTWDVTKVTSFIN